MRNDKKHAHSSWSCNLFFFGTFAKTPLGALCSGFSSLVSLAMIEAMAVSDKGEQAPMIGAQTASSQARVEDHA